MGRGVFFHHQVSLIRHTLPQGSDFTMINRVMEKIIEERRGKV